jgi:DNA-binding beta-propeller fold protein YncE
VEPNGIIDTVAGNGLAGFSGDGGPALKARLNHPCGLAIDSKGNLLIADSWNNCIRRVDPTGVITTVAGTKQPGFGGDGGPAERARLYHPYGIAVAEDGSIWIADRSGNRLRKVRPDGTIVSIAGQGSAGYEGDAGPPARAKLNRPSGIAVDRAGNLYIADSWNHRIRRITASDGRIK